ncbi:sensor histidine kinase [Micromonospora polyrhachis]|uniref:histidine kinase n=1 Tax=Micromonospora polyrhachis TaxID=1282883 RepID=A0A7W7SRV4_9ACTN|nr:sensor histidine kinase [Micromonospora polyrhachis]MBB4959830.1 signal transduction histidine kinase [Micromonospora polyrhachis]
MLPINVRRAVLLLGDLVAGVLITVAYLTFAELDGTDGLPAFSGPPWLGWLVAAAVGLPLAARRIRPRTVLAAVTAATATATLLDLTREPYVAVAFALYLVALREPVRWSVSLLAATLLVSTAGVYLGEAVLTPSGSVADAMPTIGLVWLVVGAGWVVGVVTRHRRARADQAAHRERERDKQQIQAAERLRIAREMHDIVSHHLSLIAVQAGIANHVAEEHPAEAREALRVIETTSRGALTEMRGMLGVLRVDPERAATTRKPAPGLAGLSELADRAAAAGVTVELDVTTVGTPPPPGVQLATYRIVQEALTNVVKHAAPAHCAVRVVAGDGLMTVDVTDDGVRPARNGSGGHGLIGMRERVTMYGGDLTAGPCPDAGFTVSARIPYLSRENA